MDIRDYLRMLRRGWLTVTGTAVLVLLIAAVYLFVTPKTYESTSVLYLGTTAPEDVVGLQQGAQFNVKAVVTYAEIIDSTTVLGPAALSLRPQRNAADLVDMVTASVRPETTLIDLSVVGEDPEDVAAIANAAAASAIQVISQLEPSASGQPLVRLQQIRPATEPTTYVSPNPKRTLSLALIVGLCLGLILTIARQALDTRIRRPEDLALLTASPVLGVVPSRSRRQLGALPVATDPEGPVGDAIRTLRANVRYLETSRRSLAIAPVSDDGDGGLVAANLAWVLAQAGQRVVLVDFDLRSDAVAVALEIHPAVGLGQVLADTATLTDAMSETSRPGLTCIASGGPMDNPSALTDPMAVREVISELEKQFDYVISSLPPVLQSSNTSVVASEAGSVLVSVAASRTRAQDLTTALVSLSNVGVTPLGVVLTRSALPTAASRRGRPAQGRGDTPARKSMSHRLQWDWRSNRRMGNRG